MESDHVAVGCNHCRLQDLDTKLNFSIDYHGDDF